MNKRKQDLGDILKINLGIPGLSSCRKEFSDRIDEIRSNYIISSNYDFESEEKKLLNLIEDNLTTLRRSKNKISYSEEGIEYSARTIGYLAVFLDLVGKNIEPSHIREYINHKLSKFL